MSVRPASHAGTWYTGSATKLTQQLDSYFKKALPTQSIPGARVLIGPHAGYAYSGQRLAETFKSWDSSNCKRVFILGPSHQLYFKGKALLSSYSFYETPLGNIPVDVETVEDLVESNSRFKYMSEDADEVEHSFEMHAPFIYYATKDLPQGVLLIVPIMICGTDDTLIESIVNSLLPYIKDPQNTFVISSDFCHWGSRFDYTMYVPKSIKAGISSDELISLSRLSLVSNHRPIYESIEDLDKEAMRIASTGSYASWKEYIKSTGNTICGQKPIAIVLRLLEKYSETDKISNFKWLGYSQSSKATCYTDSSVSYASGYLVL